MGHVVILRQRAKSLLTTPPILTKSGIRSANVSGLEYISECESISECPRLWGQISTARLNFPPDNLIWCWEFHLKYLPSARPPLSVVVPVYLLSNTEGGILWTSQRRGYQPWRSPFQRLLQKLTFSRVTTRRSCRDGGTAAGNMSSRHRGVPEPEWKNS